MLRFLPLVMVAFFAFAGSTAEGTERLYDQFYVPMARFSTADEKNAAVNTFDRPLFGEDVEFYLGQRRRRSGNGGRVWTNIYGGTAVLHPTRETNRIRPDLFGVQVGFDVVRSQMAYFSLFYNYNYSKIGIRELLHSRTDNHFIGAGYFVYLSGCHFGIQGGIGYDQYKADNDIGGAKGDGLQTDIFSEFGIDFPVGKWAIKPFFALQHDFVYHGRIGDTDNIIQGDWNVHSLAALLGLRVNWKPLENLEFQARSTWVHEMLDRPPPFYKARFSAVHGTSTPAIFHYQGNTGRDWAWLGLGLKFEFNYNMFLFCDYDVMFNARLTSHLGSIGLCLGW